MSETSPSIGKLVEALAKAQSEFEPILKETDNPAYLRSGRPMKYADLPTLIAATQPALTKNGLVIIQMPDVDTDTHTLSLTGLMAHSSGEWIKSVLRLPAVQRDRFDPQSCGSAITYAKRYQYGAMIGAAPEEDDDGNAASGVGSRDAQQAVAKGKIAAHEAKTGVTGYKTEAHKFTGTATAAGHSVPSSAAQSAAGEGGAEGQKGLGAAPLDYIMFHAETISRVWKTRPHDWQRLSGSGMAQLLVGLGQSDPHFKSEFLYYDEAEMYWYVLKSKADVLADAAVSMGLDAKQAPQGPQIVPERQETASGEGLANDLPRIEAVRKVTEGVTTPVMWVKLGTSEYGCFHKSMWPHLEAGIGMTAELDLSNPVKRNGKTYQNIVGIGKIGETTFTESVPDLQQRLR